MPGKNPIQIVNQRKGLIKDMMYQDRLYDKDIIKRLRDSGIDITERTFYHYKRRIQIEESDIWDKIAVDSVKYRAVQLIQSLEESVLLNEKIRDDI